MESKVTTMNYIEKLRNSFTQSEIEKLLPAEIVTAINPPHFDFGSTKFYPKDDFESCIETAYTGAEHVQNDNKAEDRIHELEEQLKESKEEANAYVEEISRLENELSDCKQKLTEKMSEPKYEKGNMEKVVMNDPSEFYNGEMMACIFDALDEYSKNHRPESPTKTNRAYEVAEEVKRHFNPELYATVASTARRFRESVEKAVDKAYESSTTNLAPLTAIGFVDVTSAGSKHFKVRYKDNANMTFVISRTPSAYTSRENCKRSITSRLCIV